MTNKSLVTEELVVGNRGWKEEARRGPHQHQQQNNNIHTTTTTNDDDGDATEMGAYSIRFPTPRLWMTFPLGRAEVQLQSVEALYIVYGGLNVTYLDGNKLTAHIVRYASSSDGSAAAAADRDVYDAGIDRHRHHRND